MTLEGKCACGAVKYRMTSEPMFVHCCHCLDCQRQTGSGLPHDCYRCPGCQTAVWSTYGGRTALRFVRVGTLDNPHALKPDVHIYTRSKVPWVKLPDDVPAFEAYYNSKKLWPAASLERRKAVFG